MTEIDALEQAWKYGAELLADDGLATELERPTPCAGWDVRALLNHLLGESAMQSEVNRGGPSVAEHGDVIGGRDVVTTWARTAEDNVASWREAGVEGERAYFYGTFPAAAALAINIGEVVVHSWDLAMALRRPLTCDPEHVAIAYGLWSAVPLDGLRAAGKLGPEVSVAADAPMLDRLLGLLGRQP